MPRSLSLTYTVPITLQNSQPNRSGVLDSSKLPQILAVLGACSLFIALGVLLIPLTGIQTDEALFATPLYEHSSPPFFNRLIHLRAPTMVMTYLGALKTLLYYPVFKLAGTNVWTTRLPMVLAGGVTIFIFYALTALTVSRRAALLGAFLLASDPIVLMTSTFDWGPVALEHLLLVIGCYGVVRFGRNLRDGEPKWHGAERRLAAGFFCFGLALWNKAIFSWALTGLTVASLVTLWPCVRRAVSARNASIAIAAFVLGAAPLILYNVRHHGATFSGENTNLVPSEIPTKWASLESALQGNSVFGYIAGEESWGPLKAPASATARASTWLRGRLGPRQNSEFYYVLGALLVLVPLWWRSRVAWFSLIFCSVAWLLMAMTHNAGGSAHHVVLLWPFPILFAVIVLDRLPSPLGPAVATILVAMNLTVVNQYLFQLNQNGSTVFFTDAIMSVSDALDEKSSHAIYIGDWGMLDSINLLHQGRLELWNISGQLNTSTPSPAEAEDVARALHDPNGLLVTHAPGQEIFPNVNKHLNERVSAAGMRREVLRVINDSNGRPMFEISRIVPAN